MLEGPHFSPHQVPEIPLWIRCNSTHVFEKPSNSLSSEQLNLNTKQLAMDNNIIGRSLDKWLIFLDAYPAVQCLAGATSSCFSVAQVKCPG